MGKKIIISHPTGNENTRHAVLALYKSEMLKVFITCVACLPGNIFDKLSGVPGLSEFKKRSFDVCLGKFIKSYPFRELLRLLKRKITFIPTVTVDDVYHHIDRKVRAYIRKHHVDGVYAYDDGALETFRYAKKKGMKCFFDLPIVHWRCYQSLLTDEAKKNPEWAETLGVFGDSKEKLKRKDEELQLADCVFVASSFTKESILKYYPYELSSPIKVIPYGFPNVYEERTYEDNTHRKLKFLFVGRLSQSKGLSYLFDAVKHFGNDIELSLIGFNSYPSCKALQENLAMHNYLGPMPHDKVLQEMRKADVFIFPSLFEGFGMVITEAMSQGTPVIATDRTCAVDLIKNGENGWVIKAGSVDSLINAINDAISRREQLGEMGRKAMETARLRPWCCYEKELSDAIKQQFNAL